jgi:hypothetical protein
MNKTWEGLLQVDLPTGARLVEELEGLALRRHWDLALVLVGWLHLLAFGCCYCLTVVANYHEAPGYLALWAGELLGAALIFRACGGSRSAGPAPGPLLRLVRRVWIAYFILAFDLASLNTLRGHRLFEFFPAIRPLASFAFLIMTALVSRRFFGAVLVMYASGLLMAAHLLHAYLVFGVAWWLVLNWTGISLCWRRRNGQEAPAARPPSGPLEAGGVAELPRPEGSRGASGDRGHRVGV